MSSFIDDVTIYRFPRKTALDENRLSFIEADPFAIDPCFNDLKFHFLIN